MLGDTREEILINKLGILHGDAKALVGPTVDFGLATHYCRAKGLDLYTLSSDDLDYFGLTAEVDGRLATWSGVTRKLADRHYGGDFLKQRMREEWYRCAQASINELLVQDINKMLCKAALDILNSNFGLTLKYKPGDFDSVRVKGRAERITPGGGFG